MKKLVIAAGGIVIVIVAGFFLYRHFVINSVMDGPFMENISPDERATEPEQKPKSASAQEPEEPYLYCSYTNPETRERIELGDEMFIYKLERCPRIPHERWQELANYLRKAELTPYQSPDPQLLDGTDSKLELTWSADGQQITETFDGRSADGLFKLLQDITQGV